VRFERVPLMCDNISVILVAKNSVFHKKMRYVERRHHFLRDHVEKGDIEMWYIDTDTHNWSTFSPNLLILLDLLIYEGGNWCLPSIRLGLRGSWCICLVYFAFLL
jgi:hypothetical protein